MLRELSFDRRVSRKQKARIDIRADRTTVHIPSLYGVSRRLRFAWLTGRIAKRRYQAMSAWEFTKGLHDLGHGCWSYTLPDGSHAAVCGCRNPNHRH